MVADFDAAAADLELDNANAVKNKKTHMRSSNGICSVNVQIQKPGIPAGTIHLHADSDGVSEWFF